MHIGYDTKNGTEYAKLCRSHYINGKDKKTYENLGKVIDKEKHIFKNRQRGLFQFDPETGIYTDLNENEFSLNQTKVQLILNFGDVWFLDRFIRSEGLNQVFDCVGPELKDGFYSLICFYILNHLGLCHSQDWYEHSVASLLYPQADLRSQKTSQLLEKLSSESIWREFFKRYISYLKTIPGDVTRILIDSTGLPNSIHFPLTGISNHNGQISNEIRLIYVTEQQTGMPIFMRYVNGTIPDVSTVETTYKELRAQGIEPDIALMDAGYYSEKNVMLLHKANIRFVCRMKENLRLYKELCAEHAGQLESRENLVKFGRRLAYIKKKRVLLAPGVPGYAYICEDLARKSIETEKLLDKMDPNASLDETIFESLASEGLFVLVSSDDIETDRILPIYCTRQEVEQTFDISKNYVSLLPLRTHSEETFRGHLLITFAAAAIVKRLQYCLVHEQKKRDKNLNPVTLLQNLGYQHCSVYQDKVVIEEADSRANQGYRIFGIDSPKELIV